MAPIVKTKFDERNQPYSKSIDFTLTVAQLLALNATPIEVLPALPAGKAYANVRCVAVKKAGTAYTVATNKDITFRYTNASGQCLCAIETTGFLDQTTKQIRYCPSSDWATNAPSSLGNYAPVESANVVAAMTTGEITTGNSDLNLRIYFSVVPTSLEL